MENQKVDPDKTFVHPLPIALNSMKMDICHLEKT